ncbi:hypothetical protein [Psychroflexus aestuariivivens]|uniref:hypothetical protein n=1 Tax=Psychroflexus aestuariivivens TaxID=1795040 RepID=UPI000FD7A21A|nr:hypothetical protein [Psychroflexus aestuariivivens]
MTSQTENKTQDLESLKSKAKTLKAILYFIFLVWLSYISYLIYEIMNGKFDSLLVVGTFPIVAVIIIIVQLKSKNRKKIEAIENS